MSKRLVHTCIQLFSYAGLIVIFSPKLQTANYKVHISRALSYENESCNTAQTPTHSFMWWDCCFVYFITMNYGLKVTVCPLANLIILLSSKTACIPSFSLYCVWTVWSEPYHPLSPHLSDSFSSLKIKQSQKAWHHVYFMISFIFT